MAEDGNAKIDNLKAIIWDSERCRLRITYIRRNYTYRYLNRNMRRWIWQNGTCWTDSPWHCQIITEKNVAYNIVNEKTTFGLIKALSNMYEKSSATNKVFLIKELVNIKTKEGAFDHVNEFNPIISKLGFVEIKFEDKVQEFLLL